jgi:hypothetical protein
MRGKPTATTAVEHDAGPSIGRDLHRLLAGAVANHLERAAALLRQDPNVDALLLGASGTAKVIVVLATAATRIGATLSSEAVQAIQGLRVWLHGQRRRLQAGTAAQRIVVTAPRTMALRSLADRVACAVGGSMAWRRVIPPESSRGQFCGMLERGPGGPVGRGRPRGRSVV